VSRDYSELTIGGEIYTLGSGIKVFSVLSQESFEGIVSAITDNEVVVRTYVGPRFCFSLAQVQTGRVLVSRHQEVK
jgi:hypothetical protein